MKKVVILSDTKHISKVSNFLQDATVIATNLDVERHLQKRGIDFKSGQDYIKLKSISYYILKGKKFIRDWINENPNFNNFLYYDNIHFFDLLGYNLVVSSNYYYALGDIIKTIDLLEAILKKEKNSEIIAVEDGNLIAEILKLVSNPMLIKSKNNFSYYKRDIIPILARFILKFKLHYRGKSKYNLKDFQNKIITLAAGHNYITPILPLIKDMKKDFLVIKPLQLRNDKVSKILKQENIPFISIESFLDKNLIYSAKNNTKKLIKNLDILLKNENFISSFEYKRVPIFNVFKKTLICLLKKREKILEAIINLELDKKILKSLNPKLFLLFEEENLHSRSILKLAKRQKIPTLYMQHGFLSRVLVKNTYLSDKVLVWGETFKEGILKYNKHKKENEVLITGRLMKKYYNKELILNKLNIPTNKKIVTFATNTETNKELILEILDITKELDDVQLVIKLHPSENGRLQKKLARLTKTKPVIIKDINIDELMDISDLVIVSLSTVGLIALNHNKPLIVVNLSGLEDEMDYIKSGAAIGINNLNNLKNSIKSLLYNKQDKEKLLKNAKPYISKHLANCDSLKKTKSVIKELINI